VIRLVQDYKDFEKIDKEINDLVGSFSPILPGSVSVIHPAYHWNWKIKTTSEIIEYANEMAKRQTERIAKLDWETARDLSFNTASDMAAVDVEELKGLKSDKRKRRTNILDIYPTNADGIINKILEVAKAAGDFCGAVIIVQPIRVLLEEITTKLTRFKEWNFFEEMNLIDTSAHPLDVMKNLDDKTIDLLVINRQIYEKTNNHELAKEAGRIVKEDGLIIDKGVYFDLWTSPAKTYWFLSLIKNIEDEKLAREIIEFVLTEEKQRKAPIVYDSTLENFRKMFDLEETDLRMAFSLSQKEERTNNVIVMKTWASVINKIKNCENEQKEKGLTFLSSNAPKMQIREDMRGNDFAVEEKKTIIARKNAKRNQQSVITPSSCIALKR